MFPFARNDYSTITQFNIACKYNRRALRKVTSSFEEVLYINDYFAVNSGPNNPKYLQVKVEA